MRRITMKDLLDNVTTRAMAGAGMGAVIGQALEDKVEVLQVVPGLNKVAMVTKLSTTAVATIGGFTIGVFAGVGETFIDAARDVA